MKKIYKKWTPEEKEYAALLLSQYTINQVAKKLNRSIGSIKDLATNQLKDSYCRSKLFRQSEGILQASVAQQLGVTRSHVNNWIKMNNLPAIKCGKKGFFVIHEKSLFNWLLQGNLMLPMLNPPNLALKNWLCENRKWFLIKHISAKYIRHINCITRGALDNWIKSHEFPRPIIKIGKLGFFYNRQEVINWCREHEFLVSSKKVAYLSSYDGELEFLNHNMRYQCPL